LATPLLRTKLHIPAVRSDLVPRQRLLDRLNAGLRRKLILISAPAGFGKTTLLSAWLHQARDKTSLPEQVAWVSLDERDNEGGRFLAHAIAALQTIEAGIGQWAQGALQSPQPPPPEAILTALVNDICAIPGPFVLILDDYHLINAPAIHSALSFLLDHLPPQMCLVISTRSDPFLRLSRLRARGQVTELREDDLRFTLPEAASFLNQVMGLGLTTDQVLALESRTEGWIAGLQLAALSLQARMRRGEDPAGFISSFSGDDRYVVDYLVDEVLDQQPKETRGFLLQTSILERMTGSLCDAVTGDDDGQAVLKALEQANLFIVPLDNQRLWYRYHHLFRVLLRQRIEESTTPGGIENLHRRASRWHEENGYLIEAVEHGIAAADYEDVIRLLRVDGMNLLLSSKANTLLGWQAELPQEVVASHPRICMIFTWAWVATGHPQEAERCLQTIEAALGTKMEALLTDRMEDVDPATRAALVEIAVVRAELAIERADIPEVLRLTRWAWSHLEGDEGSSFFHSPDNTRMLILFIMGLAHKHNGELVAANAALSEAAALAQQLGNVHVVAGAYGRMASVQAMQGRLLRARRTCEEGLAVVERMAGQHSPMSGLIHAELGNLLYEQNDLEAANHHLEEGTAVAKPWGLVETFEPGYTGLARVRTAQGDLPGAFAALDELVELSKDNPQAVMPSVESLRAKLWAAQGRVNAARGWAQAANMDADGEIDFLMEAELIVLVHVLMAQTRWDDAERLIDRLLEATETGERWGRVVELLILRALVLDAQEEDEGAAASLERALALAEPLGYVRVFVDQGEPMAGLLREAASRGASPTYVAKLLAELRFQAEAQEALPPDRDAELPTPESAPSQALVEPLSNREFQVLRLLATELTGPEIARELMVAVSTLRTHTRNIYGKLNVSNRRAAVRRAEELHLI